MGVQFRVRVEVQVQVQVQVQFRVRVEVQVQDQVQDQDQGRGREYETETEHGISNWLYEGGRARELGVTRNRDSAHSRESDYSPGRIHLDGKHCTDEPRFCRLLDIRSSGQSDGKRRCI